MKQEFSAKTIEQAKEKIRRTVGDYTGLHPFEFDAFKTQAARQREERRTKFAEVRGSETIERQIGEWPERLDAMLKFALTDEEWLWFTSVKGCSWFVKNWPMFAAADKI